MSDYTREGAYIHAGSPSKSLADNYLELARSRQLWTDDLDDALRKVLVAVASALSVEQVGIWSFNESRDAITQKIQFDAALNQFAHGFELRRDDHEARFASLESGRISVSSNALFSAWEHEFPDWEGQQISAFMDCAIYVAGEQWGVLYIGHIGTPRLWAQDEIWFASSVADLVNQLVAFDKVRRGEHELRFVSDNLPIGVLKADSDGACLYVNPCWCELAAVTPVDVSGERWLQAIHPDDRTTLMACIRQVAETGVSDDCECRFIANGQVIWVAVRWVSALDINGFPSGVLGTFTDIRQQRALRENEHRYRMLFENYSDAIFLIRGSRYVDCNDRALSMFGCTREQILEDVPYRFSPEVQPDGQPSVEKALQKIGAAFAGERQLFEWRHLRYDGSPFDAEVALIGITLDGEPHLLSTLRDISERKRAERELAESHQRLARIHKAAERLYGKRDVAGVAQETVSILAEHTEHTGISVATFHRYDEDTQTACLIGYNDPLGMLPTPSALNRTFKWSPEEIGAAPTDFSGWSDVTTLPISTRALDELLRHGTKSLAVMWLCEEQQRIGLISLEYPVRVEFDEATRKDLAALAKVVGMALANALAIARLEQEAARDSLTGLPNRQALQRELIHLGAHGGLLLLDLDRFKEINDTLGHHMGDKLLIEVGRRLPEVLSPEHNFLCRLGGDEFAILVRNQDPTELQRTASRLLRALRQPFQIEKLRLQIGCSIGIAVFPEHGTDGHDLLRCADVAMYAAKCTGGSIAFYDRQVDAYSLQRLAIMQELRAGVQRNQLVLHYQPKLDLASGDVDGFEALVRWQHPQRGLLQPGEFVPLAEVTDVIHALTAAVLDLALAQQRKWLDRGLRYSMAVNLSVRNLLNSECFDHVEHLLQKHDIDPRLLELEITETTLMHDPDGAIRLLQHLAAIGVRFSIDDFGTGYSSLSYLRRLPIHALKIDRAFVTGMLRSEPDAVIVRSTIALAHNLKLGVIAEGVEDAATLEVLRQMGCDRAQGYFISRPQPPAIIEDWLNRVKSPSVGAELGANI